EPTGFRKEQGHFFVQAFDTWSASGQTVFGLTGRAVAGEASSMTAVMALQPPGKAMFDQPGGTVGALQAMTAAPTERKRRVATAVEEEKCLFAGGQGLFDRIAQGRRKPSGPARGEA